MEKARIIKRRKLTVSETIIRRQNLLEKEILPLYSVKEEGNPSDTAFGY